MADNPHTTNANPYTSPRAESDTPDRDPGRCPTCGGRVFREGTVRTNSMVGVFVPDDWPYFRWREGLGLKSVACVACGHVRQFVVKKDLDELQRG